MTMIRKGDRFKVYGAPRGKITSYKATVMQGSINAEGITYIRRIKRGK